MIGPSRLSLLTFAVTLPISGLVIAACNGGEEVAYDSAGLTPDAEVDAPDSAGDSGRVILESGVLPTKSPDGGGPIPPREGPAIMCPNGIDLDGGACDPAAGLGCCLNSLACETQGHYFQGDKGFCQDSANHVFIACKASTADSICCWQKGVGPGFHTRMRADCDGGFEACDPSADDGGTCQTGGACKTATCSGIEVGYCGGGPSPCP